MILAIILVGLLAFLIWWVVGDIKMKKKFILLVLERKGRVTCHNCEYHEVACDSCKSFEDEIIKKHGEIK